MTFFSSPARAWRRFRLLDWDPRRKCVPNLCLYLEHIQEMCSKQIEHIKKVCLEQIVFQDVFKVASCFKLGIFSKSILKMQSPPSPLLESSPHRPHHFENFHSFTPAVASCFKLEIFSKSILKMQSPLSPLLASSPHGPHHFQNFHSFTPDVASGFKLGIFFRIKS